jgi:hypothetical protein
MEAPLNRFLPLLLAASIPISLYAPKAGAHGRPANYRPHVTGEQLVRDMRGEPGVGRNSLNRERAMGYIDGVMDTAAGRRWCPAGKAVPHEMNYLVTEALERLSPAQLKGDASALVLAVLAKEYPCSASRGTP